MKEWRGRMVKAKRADAGRQYEDVKEHGFKRPESNQKADVFSKSEKMAVLCGFLVDFEVEMVLF